MEDKMSQSPLVSAIQESPITKNGALTLPSSGDPVTDFFFSLGSVRKNVNFGVSNFFKAYEINPLNAVKILFYSRDIRGGQGERRLFRTILKEAANRKLPFVEKNIHLIPVYGRWDDIFSLVDTPVESTALKFFAQAIRNSVSLAAKWAPREKSSKRTQTFKVYTKTISETPFRSNRSS